MVIRAYCPVAKRKRPIAKNSSGEYQSRFTFETESRLMDRYTNKYGESRKRLRRDTLVDIGMFLLLAAAMFLLAMIL
jgi:hypothetical protein